MSFQPATVFFLAAGFGTRLRPLTERVPKALVPVGNVPQLFRLAERYPNARLIANAHHLAAELETAVHAWQIGSGALMTLSHEREVLGTAGGIRAARGLFAEGPVLVHNADIDIPAAATDVLAAAEADALSTLLVSADRPLGIGNVGLDGERRVVRLRGVQAGAAEVVSCDYLGVALLAPELVEGLPDVGCLVGDGWIPALSAGRVLRAVAPPMDPSSGFFDLGTPRSYLEANLAWLHAQGLRVRAEPGARLHSACKDVLAGAGAVLEAACERVVAWPGAHSDRALTDAIVTGDGIVEIEREVRS